MEYMLDWLECSGILNMISLELMLRNSILGKPSEESCLEWSRTGYFGEALLQNFTRQNLLSKVAGIYDPISLVTPITSCLKLDLHDLCLENLNWDDQIQDTYPEKWIKNLKDIQSLGSNAPSSLLTLPPYSLSS